MIVEVNEAGEILIPAELVQAPSHTRLEADREGDLDYAEALAGDACRKRPLRGRFPPVSGGQAG